MFCLQTYLIRPDQELVALSCCNFVGSCFQCFPNATSLSRTCVVSSTGGITQLHQVSNALVLVFTLSFMTPLLYALPNAVLGAVVLFGVYGMLDFKEFIRLAKIGDLDWVQLRNECNAFKCMQFFRCLPLGINCCLLLFALPLPSTAFTEPSLSEKNVGLGCSPLPSGGLDVLLWLVCFLITIIFGAMEGILASILLSLLWLLRKTARPSYCVLGRLPETYIYRNIKRFPMAVQEEGIGA